MFGENDPIKLLFDVEAQKDYYPSPVYIGNSISRYSMEKKDLIPGIPDEKYTYDKLEVIQICLREDMDQKNDPLIQMLNTLFSSTKTKEEIKKELSEQ